MIVKDASTLLFVSLSTVTVSVVSKTTLFPPINSKVDPCGIGAFLSNCTSSVAPARVIPTPTLTPDPDVFASVIPITTVVVAAGAVYIPTVVTPTLAFVFNLKVFAIVFDYPKAIARAVASPTAAADARVTILVPP